MKPLVIRPKNRAEWLEHRKDGIGSSEVATILGQRQDRCNDSPTMIKIKEFMSLYGIIDIKMRMLRIDELKNIMGFPSDYVLVGSKADQKKFIGNAVEVNMARVLCEALCARLIEGKKTPKKEAA